MTHDLYILITVFEVLAPTVGLVKFTCDQIRISRSNSDLASNNKTDKSLEVETTP